jgi:hypothetical protein
MDMDMNNSKVIIKKLRACFWKFKLIIFMLNDPGKVNLNSWCRI